MALLCRKPARCTVKRTRNQNARFVYKCDTRIRLLVLTFHAFFSLLFIFKSALSESHHQQAVLSAGAWAFSTEACVPRCFRGLSMALMRLDTPVRLSETDLFSSAPFPPHTCTYLVWSVQATLERLFCGSVVHVTTRGRIGYVAVAVEERSFRAPGSLLRSSSLSRWPRCSALFILTDGSAVNRGKWPRVPLLYARASSSRAQLVLPASTAGRKEGVDLPSDCFVLTVLSVG